MRYTSLLLLFLVALLSSCGKKCIDVEVPYTEQEPYQALESFYEEAKYNVIDSKVQKDYDCLEKGFWGDCKRERWFLYMYTTLENLESEPVEFTVGKHFSTFYDGDVDLEERIIIPAYGTRKVEFKHFLENEYANYEKPTYSVDAESIERQKYVTKYRTLTKYRNCNTCVEDCGGKYDDEGSGTPWWVFALAIVGGLVVVGWIIGLLQSFFN